MDARWNSSRSRSDTELAELANSEDPDERRQAASLYDLPLTVLERLATYNDPEVLAALVVQRESSTAVIEAILALRPELVGQAGHHQNAPTWVLDCTPVANIQERGTRERYLTAKSATASDSAEFEKQWKRLAARHDDKTTARDLRDGVRLNHAPQHPATDRPQEPPGQ